MTQLGADPDDLSGLSRSLRDAAGRLDSLSSGLARRVHHTRWSGPDALALHRSWRASHRPQLARCAAGLRELAARAEQHRSEQEQASRAGAGPALHLPAPHPRPTRPSAVALAPLPVIEDRYRGTIEGRLGPLSGQLTGELTVARLTDGRVRVTLAESTGAGGVLSVGGALDVAVGGPHGAHGATSGTAADAAARVGGVWRRVWEVDEDRVDDLLARVAVEHAALAATRRGDPQVAVAGALDGLVERLTGEDPGWDHAVALATAVPTPRSTEVLAEVELAAGAAAGLGGLLGLAARAQASQVARVGAIDHDGRRGAVIELEGAATAAVTSSLLRRAGVALPSDLHHAASVRVVVMPSGHDAPARVDVRVRLTDDTEVHDTVVRLHPRATADARVLSSVAQRVAHGDATAALAMLQEVRVDAGHVELHTGTGTLSGHSARAAGGGGLGPGGGVTVRGQVVRIDRR